jgi:hypothetical protein
MFLLLLAGWMVFNLVQTVRYVRADYSQIPVADYWRVAQFWADSKAIHWGNLWVQHNEHRIVFPELFFSADMLYLHGRMYLPIVVSGLCYLGIWVALVGAAYSQSAMVSPAREAALLAAGIVMAWKGCSGVIATPFQLQFTLLQFMVAVAFLLLVKSGERQSKTALAGMVGAAWIATYTSANGMLIWPLLIGGAVLLKMSRRRILAISAAGTAAIAIFFIGYHFLPSQMRGNIRHPAEALQFLCAYFSMPFGGFRSPTFAVRVGAINVALMLICLVVAWRRDLVKSRLGMVVFGSYLFTLLSALLTTAGRMDLRESLYAEAEAWRYVTVPTVAWGLLAIALVWMVNEAMSRRWALVAALLTVAFFGDGFLRTRRWVEETRTELQNAQISALMLRNHVFVTQEVLMIFPSPEFVRVMAERLRENRKSVWAHGDDRWIGRDMATLHPVKLPVAGRITCVYPVAGGLEILGWADNDSLTDDHEVVFVNPAKRIAGFGSRPAAGMPRNIGAWNAPRSREFVGFIAGAKPGERYSIYVRSLHGALVQPMDDSIEAPTFTPVESSADSARLPGIVWRPDAAWTLNGFGTRRDLGPLPDDLIYGSWSGSGEKTGTIHTEPFATPANHCLVLPVLHGTATYGQSVEVLAGDTQQAIAQLPMLEGRAFWERWRIPVPANVRNLSIVARDQGAGPDEWLSVANPEQCP